MLKYARFKTSVTIVAVQIKDHHEVRKLSSNHYEYHEDGKRLEFTSAETPSKGGYIYQISGQPMVYMSQAGFENHMEIVPNV